MIRFGVFPGNRLSPKVSFEGAHLFGQDEIPVRGQLELVEGELVAHRHGDTAVGLSTLWEVEGFGKVLLQTTRLPEKTKAYNLHVELARGRLLRISQKREEWGMTDLTLDKQNYELIDQALDSFIEALGKLDEPAEAASLADRSLSFAMRAGEEMSLAHAKMFLDRRSSSQGFARHIFGCCFDPARIGDQTYLKYVKDNFNFVTVPLTWRQIEPNEQEHNFEWLDECINWLWRNRIAVKLGPLVSFSPQAVPDWLFIWENDFEQVREMAYEYVTNVVQRYQNRVQAWDVASGLNADNCFKFSFEQIIEMTRSVALAAKRVSHRSLVLIEMTEPWGEYYAVNQRTIPPFIYADMIGQSGVNFDGFGIKLRFGRGGGGMRARDLLELSSLLDRFAVFGKSVHLAGVQVPSQRDPRDANGRIGEAGFWHGSWSEQTQADWLEQAYQIALSKPYVESITWQDLVDRDDTVLQNGGLLRKDLSPKPAFERLCRLKDLLIGPRAGRPARP